MVRSSAKHANLIGLIRLIITALLPVIGFGRVLW